MNGYCPLCRRKNVEIQESHYVPASLYPKTRQLMFVDRHGIEKSFAQDSEIKMYLLCFDCEQRFSKRGESEVLKHVAAKIANKEIPLLKKLETLTPVEDEDGVKSYCGAEAGLDMDMFAYFALSIAWRATFSWKLGEHDYSTPVNLSSFQEPIRQFLAAEVSEFPRDTAVTVIVANDDVSRKVWVLPGQSDSVWSWDVSFPAFGFRFRVTVGRYMNEIVRRDSCHNKGKLIHVADLSSKTEETLNGFPKVDGASGEVRNRLAHTP
jgi:hypothetical protein